MPIGKFSAATIIAAFTLGTSLPALA